ncbi:glutamate decarboxylase [Singulisphaera sp. PoT]|uniref:glutamate decarboxylase n=1 Tax=Singulisphaera sp. PoT TaxID=3411797 RepID=UPI003BF53F5F
MLSKQRHHHKSDDANRQYHVPTYGSRYFAEPVPKFELPENAMPAEAAHQICRDELNLDGNAALNLASFVTTWMEPEAEKLILESLNKNYVDQDEYPRTTAIQERCVNMIAHLYHAPSEGKAVGTSTVGSSEAIMLAGLAAKWRWRQRRKAEGKSTDQPNIVMSATVQVVWEKFARYFDVEPRYVPVEEGRTGLDAEGLGQVDENTIAVVAILGSTYTGEYEPIEAIHGTLEEINARNGWEVPIHVDAASGGFVAPFLQPHLRWDFRLPLVKSINVSGHKYGLVYPGIGWVVWRDRADLPEDLIFHVSYLGGDEATFNLNFSKGASQVIAQYYNFLRLGREGYSRIMKNLRSTADYLASKLEETGHFALLSDGKSLPVVAFRLAESKSYTVYDISDALRSNGWIVPAYHMPGNLEGVSLLRVVVREHFSRDMADMLLDDLNRVLVKLDAASPAPAAVTASEQPVTEAGRKVC